MSDNEIIERNDAAIRYILNLGYGIECTCCGEPARRQCKDHDDGYGVCDKCLAKHGRKAFCEEPDCKAHQSEVEEEEEEEVEEPVSRTRYNDGTLVELNGCDGCCPSVINGVFCHEEGCSQVFRDYMVECWECGDTYFAEDEGEFRNRCRRCEACQYSPCADVDALEDVLDCIDECEAEDAQLVA